MVVDACRGRKGSRGVGIVVEVDGRVPVGDADEIEVGVAVEVAETDAAGRGNGGDEMIHPGRATCLEPAALIAEVVAESDVEVVVAVDISESHPSRLRAKKKHRK